MTENYTIESDTGGEQPDYLKCYCGGDLIPTYVHFKTDSEKTLPPIFSCIQCKRLYLEGTLLIPWKAFRKGDDFCQRCGGEADLNTKTQRYHCLDPLCNFSRKDHHSRSSQTGVRLSDEMKDLMVQMADTTNKTRIQKLASRYQRLKEQRNQLVENWL